MNCIARIERSTLNGVRVEIVFYNADFKKSEVEAQAHSLLGRYNRIHTKSFNSAISSYTIRMAGNGRKSNTVRTAMLSRS